MDFDSDVIEQSWQTPVLIDFWADWCEYCQKMKPLLRQAETDARGAWRLVFINIEEHKELVNRYRVTGLPTGRLIHKGEVVAEFSGSMSEDQLEYWLAANLPDPKLEELSELEAEMEASGEDAFIPMLEAIVDQHPDMGPAVILLAKAIHLSDPARAMELLSRFQKGHDSYRAAEKLRPVVQLLLFEPQGNEALDLTLSAAQIAYQNDDHDQTLAHLLKAVFLDRNYADELPWRAMFGFFFLLGEKHPLTSKYRGQLKVAFN